LGVQCIVRPWAVGGCSAKSRECTAHANPATRKPLIMDALARPQQSEIGAIRHPKLSSVSVWLSYLSRKARAER
jgi:hypothetical protein